MVNSKQEEIFANKKSNDVIVSQIFNGFKKSKILKKELGNEKKIVLSMYFGKDGKLGAKVLRPKSNLIVQEEITSILQKIAIIPGKYQNKETVTWGFIVPVQL